MRKTYIGLLFLLSLTLMGSGFLPTSPVPADLLTTKGDLISYSTQLSRLPVGTDGKVLTADSSKASGLDWTTVSGGSGLTSLNGLTAASQTFATGTAGTDFGISSATSTHTFNLPTASGTNRGALSSADWTTFNGKQAAGSYITALTSDVSATGPGSVAATVNSVGGSSAANVNSATVLANAATSANTASAIVRRDGSGNFSAGTITASLTGTASGNANLFLSNLSSPTAINQDFIFDGTKSVGSSTFATRPLRIWGQDELIIGNTTTEPLEGAGGLTVYKDSNTPGTHISVVNPNAGASAFSEMALVETSAGNKFGSLIYKNSGGTLGLFSPSQLSLAAFDGASGGIQILTYATAAPIKFKTDEIERGSITDSYTQFIGDLFVGPNTTQEAGTVATFYESGVLRAAIEVLNPSAGSGLTFSEVDAVQDYSSNQYASLKYLNSGFTTVQNFLPNQAALVAHSGATNGLLLQAMEAGAVVAVATSITNNTPVNRLTVSTTDIVATLPWRGQNGTAAAPALSSSGDTDTGDYASAANEWSTSAGGTQRMKVSTTAITATGTNLVVDTAGKGLQVKSGTNGMAGTAVLVAGTVTVGNTAVTASTICLATVKTLGTVATPQAIQCEVTAATNIVITSENVADTSTVSYLLVEAN